MQSAKFHYDNVYWQKPYDLGHIILHQIGDLCCNGGYEVPVHRQACYEISYIVSGKGLFVIDGQEVKVSENQVVLNRPGQMHKIVSSHIDSLRYVYVGFDFSKNHNDYEKYEEIQHFFDSIVQFVVTDTNNLYHIFCDAVGETITKRIMMSEMLRTYISQIIIGTYRDFSYDKRVKYHPMLQVDSEQQIVYAILNYIESNNCTVNQLSDISNFLGYSYSYLSQLFSKRMGCSIQSYFRKKLFGQAVDMIREGKSISEIAADLGYSSVYSFSRAFTNCYGESPSCYRDRLVNTDETGNAVSLNEEQEKKEF